MKLSNKIYQLRINKNLSQEKLADELLVSRQTVTKWEAGKAYPEIKKLIPLAHFFGVSVDALLNESDCNNLSIEQTKTPYQQIISFLLLAKRNTYSTSKNKSLPTREGSHDYYFEDKTLSYLDSFFGSEIFSGQEIVFENKIPIWTMNYMGRVVGEGFSSTFLKEALRNGTEQYPYRGPLLYSNGQYTYYNHINGSFEWYDGLEEIFFANQKVFECKYHGGLLK